MAGRLAFLCPGQGGQGPAMFDLVRSDAAAIGLLDTWLADAGLGAPLDTVLADDNLLFSNRLAQPLIVAATLAAWQALGADAPQPAIAAGYSIGELAAYAVAGALAPAQAVHLAARRAALMDACACAGAEQAMVAVSGMDVAAAVALARPFGFRAAIVNGADSLVAGGPAAAREGLMAAVTSAGGRATALPVRVASHTPLMAGAVAPFAALLEQQVREPAFPVLSGISAEPVSKAAQAVDHLSRQLAEPVMWMDCMEALAEAGVTVALELGPGAALARMLQARQPGIACRSVADFRSLGGVRDWLGRHVE